MATNLWAQSAPKRREAPRKLAAAVGWGEQRLSAACPGDPNTHVPSPVSLARCQTRYRSDVQDKGHRRSQSAGLDTHPSAMYLNILLFNDQIKCRRRTRSA